MDNPMKPKSKSKSNQKWICNVCGDKLPQRGLVWKSRYNKWRERGCPVGTGWKCDLCINDLNGGM